MFRTVSLTLVIGRLRSLLVVVQDRSLTRVAAIAIAASMASLAKSDDRPTRDRFLLLDSRVVENAENAKLTVGTVEKHKDNPLFAEDRPWETRIDNLYGNVIYDEQSKLYKCWYSPFLFARQATGMTLEQRERKYVLGDDREMGVCYATSKDGLKWDKPVLGLEEYGGSKENNLVLRDRHGTGVFKDLRDPDPERRYKMLFRGLDVSFSSDGIHWKSPIKCQGVEVHGDTHNNAFWAPTLETYVGITRIWGDKGRQVVRIASKDFVTWTKAEVVLEGLDSDHQTYAMPVFFHAGVYLGLVAIHEQSSDRVWTELAWSIDTKKWDRIDPGTPLIPLSEKKLAYDFGCVFACAYPIFLKDTIRLYYGGSDWLHTSWRNGSLCLATLRPDGFAGYQQISKDRPAIITTASTPYSGQAIRVTADVSNGGSIKAWVVDGAGKELAAAKPITKRVTDMRLELSDKIEKSRIQLKFELNNAKLYSFSYK